MGAYISRLRGTKRSKPKFRDDELKAIVLYAKQSGDSLADVNRIFRNWFIRYSERLRNKVGEFFEAPYNAMSILKVEPESSITFRLHYFYPIILYEFSSEHSRTECLKNMTKIFGPSTPSYCFISNFYHHFQLGHRFFPTQILDLLTLDQESNNSINRILPYDILQNIFSLLCHHDLKMSTKVSTSWEYMAFRRFQQNPYQCLEIGYDKFGNFFGKLQRLCIDHFMEEKLKVKNENERWFYSQPDVHPNKVERYYRMLLEIKPKLIKLAYSGKERLPGFDDPRKNHQELASKLIELLENIKYFYVLSLTFPISKYLPLNFNNLHAIEFQTCKEDLDKCVELIIRNVHELRHLKLYSTIAFDHMTQSNPYYPLLLQLLQSLDQKAKKLISFDFSVYIFLKGTEMTELFKEYCKILDVIPFFTAGGFLESCIRSRRYDSQLLIHSLQNTEKLQIFMWDRASLAKFQKVFKPNFRYLNIRSISGYLGVNEWYEILPLGRNIFTSCPNLTQFAVGLYYKSMPVSKDPERYTYYQYIHEAWHTLRHPTHKLAVNFVYFGHQYKTLIDQAFKCCFKIIYLDPSFLDHP